MIAFLRIPKPAAAACLAGLCIVSAVACKGRLEDAKPQEAGSRLPVVEVLAQGRVEVSLRVSEVANTFYILDAVSGHASNRKATVSAYRTAWDEKFREAEGHAALLSAYRALRDTYDLHAGLAPGEELEAPMPVPPFWTAYSQEGRFNLLVDRSLTWEEFWRDLELVMKAEDADRMRALVQKLAPAVRAMLDDCPALAGVPARAAGLLRESPFFDQVGRVRDFYGIPGDDKVELSISFVMLPGGGEATHASRREGHIVMETPACGGSDAALALDVIFHETCHVLESKIDGEGWEALAGRYFGSGRPELSAGWWIMHEALATALGQGVFLSLQDRKKFDEKWKIPMRLYTDPLIDGYARALLPIVEESLSQGRTLSSMADAAAHAFAHDPADLKPGPPAYLKRGFLVCDPGQAGRIEAWLTAHGSFGLWSFPPDGSGALHFAESHEALSGLIVGLGEKREAAEALFSKVLSDPGSAEDVYKEEGACTIRQGPRPLSGYAWLLLLSGPEFLDEALDRLARP